MHFNSHHLDCQKEARKISVNNGFTFALQFLLFISNGLGGVDCESRSWSAELAEERPPWISSKVLSWSFFAQFGNWKS